MNIIPMPSPVDRTPVWRRPSSVIEEVPGGDDALTAYNDQLDTKLREARADNARLRATVATQNKALELALATIERMQGEMGR